MNAKELGPQTVQTGTHLSGGCMNALQTSASARGAELPTPHNLSLRDYFAATVLLGIVMSGTATAGPTAAHQAAHDAYAVADEMLRERGPEVV
jgi:hypothetical protein